MPIKKEDYPKTWKEIVAQVRARSGGRCECTGQCGLHTTTVVGKRCVEIDRTPAVYARGQIVLTTAHLCHESKCTNIKHMLHLCQRCHLRVDRDQHRRNASHTRAEKIGKGTGQLFDETRTQ